MVEHLKARVRAPSRRLFAMGRSSQLLTQCSFTAGLCAAGVWWWKLCCCSSFLLHPWDLLCFFSSFILATNRTAFRHTTKREIFNKILLKLKEAAQ